MHSHTCRFLSFTSSLIYPSTQPTNTPKSHHPTRSNPTQTNPNQAITNKEGYLLHSKNTSWRWGTVPAEERVDLKDRINAALKEEEVPEVDEFTLSWRMSRVFSWMQRQCMSPSLNLFHCMVGGSKGAWELLEMMDENANQGNSKGRKAPANMVQDQP